MQSVYLLGTILVHLVSHILALEIDLVLTILDLLSHRLGPYYNEAYLVVMHCTILHTLVLLHNIRTLVLPNDIHWHCVLIFSETVLVKTLPSMRQK